MFLLAALLDIALHALRMRCVAQDLMLFPELKLKCLSALRVSLRQTQQDTNQAIN